MSRLLRSPLIALVTLLLALVPGAALAHDELLSHEPADGATVEAPEELRLTFSGQIAEVGAQVQVTGEDDTQVTDGDPVVDGYDVVQPLTDVAAGEYQVAWRVTSSDGHPISGTFAFTVEGEAEVEDTTPAAMDETEETTEDTTAEETVEATPDAPEGTTAEATADTTENETARDSTEDVSEGGGLPVWVWVVMGVAVLALVALLARTWSRGRE